MTTKTAKAPSIDRETFSAKAQGTQCRIGEFPAYLDPRQFSTGSYGWGFSGKVTMMVDGKPVQCQASINVTVIGSKSKGTF